MMPPERIPPESKPSYIPPKVRLPEDFSDEEVTMFMTAVKHGTLPIYSFEPDDDGALEKRVERPHVLSRLQARQLMSDLWDLYNDPDFQLSMACIAAHDNQN